MNAASVIGTFDLAFLAVPFIIGQLSGSLGGTGLAGTTPSLDYQIVPLTDSPSQEVTISLSGQRCLIRIYTKSINVPVEDPAIYTDPPTYENINPVFCDLYVNDSLVVGSVLCLNGVGIVRDAYLGFLGELMVVDSWSVVGQPPIPQIIAGAGGSDPVGVPTRLPPIDLRNWWQRLLPLKFGGKAPPALAGKIPGLGIRFVLTYWPNITGEL